MTDKKDLKGQALDESTTRLNALQEEGHAAKTALEINMKHLKKALGK